jgi:class 3 adenylate cyclase
VLGIQEKVKPNRVLATLLFTDLVGSTAKAAELACFRGREIDMAGDGVFATFDGPPRAVRCASAIADGLKALGLEMRAGVRTGEIEQ